MSDHVLPNVHARFHVTVGQPGVTTLETDLDVWMDGTRFHVRESLGRSVSEILGDISYHRGAGVPLRSIEAMMDRESLMMRPPPGVTELYGDLATGDGVVVQPFSEPWPMPAAELAPAATILLAEQRTDGLTAGAEVDHGGRKAITYTGVIAGLEDGAPYRTDVSRLVAGRYVVLDLARDSASADLYQRRELVLLEEDTVTDDDLAPPPVPEP